MESYKPMWNLALYTFKVRKYAIFLKVGFALGDSTIKKLDT